MKLKVIISQMCTHPDVDFFEVLAIALNQCGCLRL